MKKVVLQTKEGLATGWVTTKIDREVAEELAKRFPPRIFYAHMHLYDTTHFPRLSTMIGGRVTLREDAKRVRTVREAIGPEIDLMIDANNA